MASALFLPIIILLLFFLRQNLIVILGVSTAYAYWAFGDGVISNIVVERDLNSLERTIQSKEANLDIPERTEKQRGEPGHPRAS